MSVFELIGLLVLILGVAVVILCIAVNDLQEKEKTTVEAFISVRELNDIFKKLITELMEDKVEKDLKSLIDELKKVGNYRYHSLYIDKSDLFEHNNRFFYLYLGNEKNGGHCFGNEFNTKEEIRNEINRLIAEKCRDEH